MSAVPWCPDSGKIIKYSASRRVRCERCGKRVPVIGFRLNAHRVPGSHQKTSA